MSGSPKPEYFSLRIRINKKNSEASAKVPTFPELNTHLLLIQGITSFFAFTAISTCFKPRVGPLRTKYVDNRTGRRVGFSVQRSESELKYFLNTDDGLFPLPMMMRMLVKLWILLHSNHFFLSPPLFPPSNFSAPYTNRHHKIVAN